jgi:hypothetical protein
MLLAAPQLHAWRALLLLINRGPRKRVSKPLRWECLPCRAGQDADLLQDTRDVHNRPILNDLAVADAMDRNPVGLDFLVRRGDPHKFPLVHASAHDAADDRSPSATCIGISWRPGVASLKISAACFIPSRSKLTPGIGGLCATKFSAM